MNKSKEEVVYEWFAKQRSLGKPCTEDEFVIDRTKWDGMASDLVENGHNIGHNDIKRLVLKVRKSGVLGGVEAGISFRDQLEILQSRKENKRVTGHPEGIRGIISDLTSWARIIQPAEMGVYYDDPRWGRISRSYRASQDWRCELCLRWHQPDQGTLVTHHLTYTHPVTGEPVLYNEPPEILMALCKEPCHQLADLARYFVAGRIPLDVLRDAAEPLFHGLGRGF